MSIDSEIYNSVERVLDRYPKSWSENYYRNKEDVVVVQKESFLHSIKANYDHEENIITVYGDNFGAVPHELFHMAFRDRDKVGEEFTKDCIYSNGIGFSCINGNKKNFVGLVEGFTEYLTRFCSDTKGHDVEYFFVSQLLSIYGEDILEYCFNNDPAGFIIDERFYNITKLAASLDIFSWAVDEIHFSIYLKDSLDKIAKESNKGRKEILEMIREVQNSYNKSIINAFNSLINEYQACSNPKISKDEFIANMSLITIDPTYKVAFGFRNNEYDVGKCLQKSIDEFKRHR